MLAEPFDAALKIYRFANDHRANAELPDESAAIPTRGKCSYHNGIAIAPLPARVAKGVGLSMNRRITVLNAAIMAAAKQATVPIKERGPDRDSTFVKPELSLLNCNFKQLMPV